MKSYNYGVIRIDHARLFGSACWMLFDQFFGLADAFFDQFFGLADAFLTSFPVWRMPF